MRRPKEFLIEGCDSDVIDYIEYLEEVADRYEKLINFIDDLRIDVDEILEDVK